MRAKNRTNLEVVYLVAVVTIFWAPAQDMNTVALLKGYEYWYRIVLNDASPLLNYANCVLGRNRPKGGALGMVKVLVV